MSARNIGGMAEYDRLRARVAELEREVDGWRQQAKVFATVADRHKAHEVRQDEMIRDLSRQRDTAVRALREVRDVLEALTHCYVCDGMFAGLAFRWTCEDCPGNDEETMPDITAAFDRIDRALADVEKGNRNVINQHDTIVQLLREFLEAGDVWAKGGAAPVFPIAERLYRALVAHVEKP